MIGSSKRTAGTLLTTFDRAAETRLSKLTGRLAESWSVGTLQAVTEESRVEVQRQDRARESRRAWQYLMALVALAHTRRCNANANANDKRQRQTRRRRSPRTR